MTSNMSPAVLFQNCVKQWFRFPKEIKHDIIYCQRALKTHIKVHQMVLEVYNSQPNPDPIQKQRILDELESQIYEINAEQQFLLLRLRRVIDEFYKTISRKGVQAIPEIMNDVISNELVPIVNDQSFLIYPYSVRLRYTEEKLIENYFEMKKNVPINICVEVLDSDEEAENQASLSKLNQKTERKVNAGYKIAIEEDAEAQVSLLKPMSQRSMQSDSPASGSFIDASQFLEVTEESEEGYLKGFQNSAADVTVTKKKSDARSVYPVSLHESKSAIEKERDDLSVPKNVKMSRLNLRQALKKAHSDTIAAKAAANQASNVQSMPYRSISNVDGSQPKKFETRVRGPRAVTAISVTIPKSIEVSSSSDDSNGGRSLTPPQQLVSSSGFPAEIVDTREKPEEYSQEMFLHMFGLYTPEMRLQMQQRRSKRKRRTVQSNERSDFHYGRIEYGSFPPPEDKKKRKAFLLSPQVKRMQSKRPKRQSAEKSDEVATTSRSSSSSPDDKRGCNECLKGGGALEHCVDCKGYYHQSCHREVDIFGGNQKPMVSNKPKLCPSCTRCQQRLLKNETKQYHSLRSTAKNLEKQLTTQKNRRASLQQESELYKTQMSKLYNIVNVIKKEHVNNSD